MHQESHQKKTRRLGFVLLGISLVLIAIFAAISLLRDSAADTTLVTFTAEPDKTVLEQLQKRADVTLQQGVSEEYVHGINGVENGDNNMYWYYYIDGKSATKPETDYITKGGELIEWKFEPLK